MMRRSGILFASLVALIAASSTRAELSVEELIAKHVEARGGKSWEKIDTLRAVGEYIAFSEAAPFTLTKKRENLYLLDHTQNAKKVVIGNDGQGAWWENHWFAPSPKPLEGASLAALSREFPFVSTLFHSAALGYSAELVGATEYDGFPAIGVKLTHPDGSVETWYLDPKSYLEIARVSPGSDFGRPLEQRTFFDDFREIDGVKIPFFNDTQWYTRNRVMQIESIEVNPQVDDAIFAMPAPPGMGPILAAAGEWSIAVEERQDPESDFQPSSGSAKIEALLNRSLLRAESTDARGNTILWDLAYDPARETYRMTTINDSQAYIDVLEGTLQENGRIVLSNVATGTTLEMFGMSIYSRASLFDVGQDGFKIEYEMSIDGGESWAVMAKESYTPAAEDGVD